MPTGSIIHTLYTGNGRSIPNHRIYFCSDLPQPEATLQGPNCLVLSGNFSGASLFTATKPLYLFSAAPQCSEVSSSFSVNSISIKMSKIYIGNLPWSTDNNKLAEAFSEHGQIVDHIVMTDRETGRSRGFGFVTFSAEEEAQAAIAAMHESELDGRRITVNVANPRPTQGRW
ncbi:unnamed protein product [Penicillium salamii]|nr:unnamed protein product [Penicillium salamii]